MTEKSALVILTDGFEEMEAIAPIDLLRRAGVKVTTGSQTGKLLVTGRGGIIVQTDTTLDEAFQSEYNLIVLPGGPGHVHLRADEKIIERLRHQEASGRLIGAICAAPAVLHEAGLLEGRKYTAHFTMENELKEIQENSPVVTDKSITTSRGAGTATEFALELISQLISQQKAKEVAQSIHYCTVTTT